MPGIQGLQAAGLAGFTATYEVSRGALTIGSARISLTREAGGGYHYESHSWPARLAGLFNKNKLHETSSGHFNGDEIRPDTYHYLRTGGDSERVAHLTFDWDSGTVVNNVAGSRWKMAVPAGTHDKLSTQLGMMQALAGGGTDFTFNVADGGTLKQYRYRVTGSETLDVPAGTFRTVRVKKLGGNDTRRTRVWCAPELGYLPVRIWRREKNGTEYTSELKSASGALFGQVKIQAD
jgi:hypothetical protein